MASVKAGEVFLAPDTLSRGSSPSVLHLPHVLRIFFSLHRLLNHFGLMGLTWKFPATRFLASASVVALSAELLHVHPSYGFRHGHSPMSTCLATTL